MTEVHGLLVVDKAQGCTSHDVVNVARRALGTRAIGHTGTLDPTATGALVLVVGEATKLVNSLSGLTKRYLATVRLGASTSTLDAEGDVDETGSIPELTRADVETAAARFVGELDQQVPKVSAIKVDGKSLYKRARSGQTFEAPTRRVRLDELRVLALRPDELDLELTCGSGFYVRSLARDLARSLGTLGHLSALRRTHNGRFEAAGAVTFQELKEARGEERLQAALHARLLPLAEVCRELPHLTLDEEGVVHARCGRAIPRAHVLGELREQVGPIVAFDAGGTPVALVELVPDHLRVLRGFRAL